MLVSIRKNRKCLTTVNPMIVTNNKFSIQRQTIFIDMKATVNSMMARSIMLSFPMTNHLKTKKRKFPSATISEQPKRPPRCYSSLRISRYEPSHINSRKALFLMWNLTYKIRKDTQLVSTSQKFRLRNIRLCSKTKEQLKRKIKRRKSFKPRMTRWNKRMTTRVMNLTS